MLILIHVLCVIKLHCLCASVFSDLTYVDLHSIPLIEEHNIPFVALQSDIDWFKYDSAINPLSNAPEPKILFIPSKWDAKLIVKLVRAIRSGVIKLGDKPKEEPKFYALWDEPSGADRQGLAYIPVPKPLPGHEESYNPSAEYIPTQEEINSYQLMFEEEKPKFIPKQGHDVFIPNARCGSDEQHRKVEELLHVELQMEAENSDINASVVSWFPDYTHGGIGLRHFKVSSQGCHKCCLPSVLPSVCLSCLDDCTAYIFHGMVYSGLNQNPLIIPLEIFEVIPVLMEEVTCLFHPHYMFQQSSYRLTVCAVVMDCKFHPRQPWLFTAFPSSSSSVISFLHHTREGTTKFITKKKICVIHFLSFCIAHQF